MDLAHLPEDILVLIFQQCRIHDVFALRLATRHFRNVLDEYSKTILPAVADQTISKSDHASLYWRDLGTHGLDWLKRLIPRFLAATLLENPSFRSIKAIGWTSILGIDPLGDELRSHLENGWKVLKQLSNISRKAYSPPVTQLANSFNQHTWNHIQSSIHQRLVAGKGRTQDFTFISQKEDIIFTRRTSLIESMSQEDAADYMLIIRLLSKCLRYHPRFDTDHEGVLSKINTAWAKSKTRLRYEFPGRAVESKIPWYAEMLLDSPCPIVPWMLWFILHIGPDPFFRQWTAQYDSGDNVDHVADLAWKMWEAQDVKTIGKRVHLATQLDLAIRKKCLRPGLKESWEKSAKATAITDTIQRGTNDHKLFIKEALLPNYFMQWRSAGGENGVMVLSEEDEWKDEQMVKDGRHPRESVPFFVYLGREFEADRDVSNVSREHPMLLP